MPAMRASKRKTDKLRRWGGEVLGYVQASERTLGRGCGGEDVRAQRAAADAAGRERGGEVARVSALILKRDSKRTIRFIRPSSRLFRMGSWPSGTGALNVVANFDDERWATTTSRCMDTYVDKDECQPARCGINERASPQIHASGHRKN